MFRGQGTLGYSVLNGRLRHTLPSGLRKPCTRGGRKIGKDPQWMTPGDSIFQLQDGYTRELTEIVTACIRFAHVQVRQGPSLEGENWGPNPNQDLIAIDTSCKGIISYLPWIATGQTPYPMVIGQHKINLWCLFICFCLGCFCLIGLLCFVGVFQSCFCCVDFFL